MLRVREIVVSLVLAACFALCVVFISSFQGERQENRAEIIQMQFDLLEGKSYRLNDRAVYLAAFQNRVLFPLAFVNFVRLGVLDANDSYLILRLAETILAFAVVYWTARGIGATPKLAAAAMLLIAYCLILTFGYNWEHPTDVLDAMFVALMVWATVAKRSRWLLLISLAAAANRESAAFAGVLWGVCYGFSETWRPKVKELGHALVLVLIPYAAVLALRYWFGGAKALASETQLITAFSSLANDVKTLTDYLTPFNWLTLGLAMFVPPLLWVGSNWGRMLPVQRRLTVAAVILVGITFWFGILSELRTFLPSIVILVLTAVWSESTSARTVNANVAPQR
jgi:hypothetical protein